MQADSAARKRGGRVGKLIGSWLATAANIATGYIWAKHGILWAAALFGGVLLCAFALYGALKYPWSESHA